MDKKPEQLSLFDMDEYRSVSDTKYRTSVMDSIRKHHKGMSLYRSPPLKNKDTPKPVQLELLDPF